MAHLQVTPFSSLVDENVTIFVGGLNPEQQVTLRSYCRNDDGDLYECFAYFVSDPLGRVMPSKHKAWFGGFYDGIEPMGLFWAMKESDLNKRKNTRMVKKNVEQPLMVYLEVYDDWWDLENLRTIKPLSTSKVERLYKARNVKRVPVKVGQIRGTLFVPHGNGPFKPVIDMFGSAGGLMEFRASMLASRGFLALSLAIFRYDDLPKQIPPIRLEYFEEAVQYLQSHPMACEGGVGVVAVSYGAEIALAMSTYVPGVNCSVCINGCNFIQTMRCTYKGLKLPELQAKMSSIRFIDDVMYIRNYIPYPTIGNMDHISYKSLIEFHKSDSAVLFIGSGDDGCVDMDYIHRVTKDVIKRNYGGAGTYQFLFYPGAGHLLELPNTPLTQTTYVRMVAAKQYFGGEMSAHAKAQEHSWKEILKFLNNNITRQEYKSKL